MKDTMLKQTSRKMRVRRRCR